MVWLMAGNGCAVESRLPPAAPQESVEWASTAIAAVAKLGYAPLGATLTEAQTDRLLDDELAGQPETLRRATATLISLGAIQAWDLANPTRVEARLAEFVAVQSNPHPALLGRFGDAALHSQLLRAPNWEALLAERALLNILGQALTNGIVTGYDLRSATVFDDLPDTQTLIYSHSDRMHLRQLLALLHQSGLRGWAYLTPKVSAFLYRDGWGGDGTELVTLRSGVRVVQGRELAVAFRFESPADRQQFHALIQQHAKRDSEQETGLLAGSWWQPFYYAHSAIDGFEPIALLVITGGGVEATLTVTEERVESVVAGVENLLVDAPDKDQDVWTLRRERVWVNPAFFRFLNGDYK